MGFCNATELLAEDVPFVDRDGQDVVVAIAKGTYRVTDGGALVPDDDPSPIRLNDVPWDPDDERSSIRYPSDLADVKLGTDVVIVGDAMCDRPVEHIDVAVRAGARTVVVRAFGPRTFYRSLSGLAMGPAAPTTRVPLRYELAYGGAADDSTVEERNPSGVGVAANASELVERPAPRIESPARPHRTARDRHAPVGVGAIMSHWLPRRSYAGTFDANWTDARMPLPPLDFDIRFNNVAHPSLLVSEGLNAGDPMAISGMSLDGALSFAVPRVPVRFVGLFADGHRLAFEARVDTILVEPERRRVEIVARRAFAMGRAKRVLREIRIDRV